MKHSALIVFKWEAQSKAALELVWQLRIQTIRIQTLPCSNPPYPQLCFLGSQLLPHPPGQLRGRGVGECCQPRKREFMSTQFVFPGWWHLGCKWARHIWLQFSHVGNVAYLDAQSRWHCWWKAHPGNQRSASLLGSEDSANRTEIRGMLAARTTSRMYMEPDSLPSHWVRWSCGWKMLPAAKDVSVIKLLQPPEELRMETEGLPAAKSSAIGITPTVQHRMEKNRMLVLDSWDANERNGFSGPRLLHLPIHRKVLNSLTWDIWLSLINGNLLMFQQASLGCKNL